MDPEQRRPQPPQVIVKAAAPRELLDRAVAGLVEQRLDEALREPSSDY